MPSWFDQNGFDFSADYFAAQAEEERVQQLKLFKYILDMGGNDVCPEVTGIKTDFLSFKPDKVIAFTDTFDQK